MLEGGLNRVGLPRLASVRAGTRTEAGEVSVDLSADSRSMVGPPHEKVGDCGYAAPMSDCVAAGWRMTVPV